MNLATEGHGIEKIDLNTYATSNTASAFHIMVHGDAMLEDHILPGDLAIVDRLAWVEEGSTVLAFYKANEGDKGQFVIRKVEGDYLVAANKNYLPILIESEIMIWGAVVGLVRKF